MGGDAVQAIRMHRSAPPPAVKGIMLPTELVARPGATTRAPRGTIHAHMPVSTDCRGRRPESAICSSQPAQNSAPERAQTRSGVGSKRRVAMGRGLSLSVPGLEGWNDHPCPLARWHVGSKLIEHPGVACLSVRKIPAERVRFSWSIENELQSPLYLMIYAYLIKWSATAPQAHVVA